jgi:ribose-phosphate pyrophosphokinase
MALYEELKIFTGNAHSFLSKSICAYLGMPLGNSEVFKFSNDNTFVRILENVRQRDLFIVQPLSAPTNDNLMELLIMMDAAKRASAGRITAVLPYYGYGRTDKKDQPRVPITGRLVADLITVAGADRVLTLDLHAGQIQGFFSIPVDELTSLPILARYFIEKRIENSVVVAVDVGISKRARDMAAQLDVPLAIIEKRRIGNDERAESLNVIGDVQGRTAILFDDEIDTGGSMLAAADALYKQGAKTIYACATHALFSGNASQQILDSKIEEVVVTDSVPLPPYKHNNRITVLTVGDILGEAIHRIHSGLSIGAMFE